MKNLILSNGVGVSTLGLGAKIITDEGSDVARKQYDIYCHAMESGKCSLFDTSESYGYNEKILGNAIKDIGNRENFTIISKIGNRSQSKGSIRNALESSLKRLQSDYIDIYLIHWPQPETFLRTWKEFEKMYEEGVVKAIGVCNCKQHHLEQLSHICEIMPMVNEIEVHPLLSQYSLVNYCYAKNIQVIAYTPIARMLDVLLNSLPIKVLSKKYKKTKTQIIIRWHYQSHRIAIPCTLDLGHFDELFDIEDFTLSDREVAWINSLDDNVRIRYNSDLCDFSAL